MENQLPATGRRSASLPLSFLLPFIILGAAFAIVGISPFGPRQVMLIDFAHQYYPFTIEFIQRVREGGSLLWSWNLGLGVNYVALYAYYLSSPFNLLLVLVPLTVLPEALALLIVVRVGLAGLFCGLLLRHLLRRDDLSIPLFAACYALCGFVLGYFHNIIWLDTFALLPLVALATLRLLRENRRGLYILALALAVWCNFFMGYYVCLYVAALFLGLWVLDRPAPAQALRRLGRIALCSLLAIGLTALVMVPTLLALQSTTPASSTLQGVGLYSDPISLVGNFAPLRTPTFLLGLPNVYTGLLGVMLLAVYLRARRVRPREKVLAFGMCALLLLTTIFSPLDFAMNAFRHANSFPARYVFLLSLTLVVMAFRGYHALERPGAGDIAGMLMIGFLVTVCAALSATSPLSVVAGFIFAMAYTVAMLLRRRGLLTRRALTGALLVLVMAELLGTALVSLREIDKVSEPRRADYPYKYEETLAVVDSLRQARPDDFYRAEVTRDAHLSNDTAALGIKGVSLFSSTAGSAVTRLMRDLGLAAEPSQMRYYYREGSPLTTALLGVDYLLSRDGYMGDTNVYWTREDTGNSVTLYRNNHSLPLGFMAEETLLAFPGGDPDPFQTQNQLLTLLTGLEEDLFLPVDPPQARGDNYDIIEKGPGVYSLVPVDRSRGGTAAWTYTLPEDGLYYAYVGAAGMETLIMGYGDRSQLLDVTFPYVVCLGEHAAGTEFTFTGEVAASGGPVEARACLYRIDGEVFQAGYALLADEPLAVTQYTDTLVEGEVTAARDGLLYTSIPYEAGWRATVDGEAVDITPLADALICIPLTAGTHTIRLTYWPRGLTGGLVVSGLSAVGVCALLATGRRKKIKGRGEGQ